MFPAIQILRMANIVHFNQATDLKMYGNGHYTLQIQSSEVSSLILALW